MKAEVPKPPKRCTKTGCDRKAVIVLTVYRMPDLEEVLVPYSQHDKDSYFTFVRFETRCNGHFDEFGNIPYERPTLEEKENV